VLDGFIAHVENDVVISAALATLNNLCALKESAVYFIENDGLNYLWTYLQSEGGDERGHKITICRILRNISLEESTAARLCQRDELDAVITSLLINADYATELFLEIVQWINALIATLSSAGNSGSVTSLMLKLSERNLFSILVDALEMDYEVDLERNAHIATINAQIAAIMNTYVLSKEKEVQQVILAEDELDEDDPEEFVPAKLIQASFTTPSALLTHHTNSIFFNCLSTPSLRIKKVLLGVGILDYLIENRAWYEAPDVSDDAVALGTGCMLVFLQLWYTDHQQLTVKRPLQCDWDLAKYQNGIRTFHQYIKAHKMTNTKSDQLRNSHAGLEQFVKLIPVLLKKYGNK